MLKEFEVTFAINTQTKQTEDWDKTSTEIWEGPDLGLVAASLDLFIQGYNQAAADCREAGDGAPDILKLHSITALDVTFEEED